MTEGVKCPNCGVALSPNWGSAELVVQHPGSTRIVLAEKQGEYLGLAFFQCTECKKVAVYFVRGTRGPGGESTMTLLWPRHASTKPLSSHVPAKEVTWTQVNLARPADALGPAREQREMTMRLVSGFDLTHGEGGELREVHDRVYKDKDRYVALLKKNLLFEEAKR